MVHPAHAEIKHDSAIIKNSLSLILKPGQVTELRALEASTSSYRNPHTEAGYFDDLDKLARAAASIRAKGVYIIPNPVDPSLLGRAVNKIRPAPKGESTTDTNIVRRRWLLIDADPIRAAGIASTDAEHKAALDAATVVADALARDGWPAPLLADSGNGGHLMYRIDLPADDGGLVQRCLESLAARHDSELVKIDKTVFNPARIWKLYGTIAAKGDAEAEAIGRPHRLARITSAPSKLEVVSAELLEALAGKAPAAPSNAKGKAKPTGNADTNHKPRFGFDLETWIAAHNQQVSGPEKWKDGRRWTFAVCPFNSEHTNEAAYIVQFGNGAIAAGCHHNGCAGKDWHALRDLVEPGWRERKGACHWTDNEARRLAEVLAESAEAIFRDRELLRALANLAEADPAEFACSRAQARIAGIRLRELDAALSPLRREIRAANPTPTAAGEYRISGCRIVHLRPTKDGEVEVPLGNFWARIVETVTRDDGAETFSAFAVEGGLVDGRPLPRATVKAADFPRMDWITAAWQGKAVVFAGLGTRDHLRCGIELLSPDRAERVEYLHTGWREVGGRWVYLDAAGAIGADGPAEGIAVALPAALSRFELPAPPDGNRLVDAVRASLRLLDLGPPRIAFPLMAFVYRAVLGSCDFSLFACGPTGVFKSEFSALCQQHFGARLDARHLPGSWSSTANSLEALGFAAKDALLVVDDFAPSGSTADVQRAHREADRFLRAVGNAAGRGRCRSDATLVQGKPPRCSPLSTGEDIPRGQSLRARLLVLEFAHGDVDAARLTACQRNAAAGLYAEALAGFLRWLAPRYQGIRDGLRAEVAELREKALAGTAHRRTPEIVANLSIGLKHFLAFAVDEGAITVADKAELLRRAWDALGEAAAAQAEHVQAADPVGQFLRLLAGALASGRAHCATPNGKEPEHADAWGWREHNPQGRRIGWINAADLYLEPEAVLAEVQELARSQGDSLPISARTLWRRLRERGLLASWDETRERNTVRRRLDGHERREVIHLRADALYAQQPSPPSPTIPRSCENGDNCRDGCALPAPDRPRDPSPDVRDSYGENCPGDGGDGLAEIAPPAVEQNLRACMYPQHRQRWRSVHGAILCGICVPPCRPDVIAEWIDGPPAK